MSKAVSAVPLLAKRFLLSKRSERFLSFIAWVSITGIALGVLALTVVTSAMNGFEEELARVVTGMNGDVIFYSRSPISEPQVVEKRLRAILPEIQAVTATFVAEAMIASPDGASAGAIVEGIDPDTISSVTVVPQRLTSGRMPSAPNEVVIGSSLADRLGLKVGSEARLVIPVVGRGESEAPKVMKSEVVGIIQMGLHDYDNQYVFALLPAVQGFLEQPGKVTTFKLKLAPGSNAASAADRLSDNFGLPFRAREWAQLNKNLFYAVKLEKFVITIILTIIVVVAAFNVVSTLMMMIHDKTKEIAILKAMGFRSIQSFWLFAMIGLGMGTIGTIVGCSAGLGVNWILGKTKLIQLPADVYHVGVLAVVTRWREVLIIALAAMLISLVATLYPAWKVSRKSPLDGLRYE